MKLDELVDKNKIKVDALKPRNTTYAALASRANAGGKMRDKKKELERGKFKHKDRFYEEEETPV